MNNETLLVQTRRLLRQYGLHVRKRLGQNFLVSDEVLQLIISSAQLAPTDIVMEVGSGLGVLTKELARHAGLVIAIELDTRLANILKQELASFGNVKVINENILYTAPAALLEEHKAGFPQKTDAASAYKVVANLPYYITSPVLRHFLETSVKPQTMVVMVQKEVADVIAAVPGQMSLLSISVQYYGKPEIIGYVPAACFYPAPKVDSAILRIEVYHQPAVSVANEREFFELVGSGFSASRKQIANSLAQGLGISKTEVLTLLERAGIKPQRRAETLTLSEWANLQKVYNQAGKSPC